MTNFTTVNFSLHSYYSSGIFSGWAKTYEVKNFAKIFIGEAHGRGATP